jgi:hypothetical protein
MLLNFSSPDTMSPRLPLRPPKCTKKPLLEGKSSPPQLLLSKFQSQSRVSKYTKTTTAILFSFLLLLFEEKQRPKGGGKKYHPLSFSFFFFSSFFRFFDEQKKETSSTYAPLLSFLLFSPRRQAHRAGKTTL